MKSIAAFTDAGAMPAYINVSQAEDGFVRVIVRCETVEDGFAGLQASIGMTEDQWYEFLRECNAAAAQKRRVEREADAGQVA